MDQPISITSIGSFSPLGSNDHDVWNNYLYSSSLIENAPLGSFTVPVAAISPLLRAQVNNLRKENSKLSYLDDAVLFAMLASRAAIQKAGWKKGDNFGINIGSSRGATGLFEKYHTEFIQSGSIGVQASPSTTPGNISSWVAQDLQANGPEISHSITCSTALHAVLNGVAWLRSGMSDKFLVGGSEAPLTAFTIAQMKAMKIYSALESAYPCRALDLDKSTNTMCLGEGAAVVCLESGLKENALAYIKGVGYATEALEHSASLSPDAECLQKSMAMAMGNIDRSTVDAIVMHAPGTIKGDQAEYLAIQKVFGTELPLLTTNKWKVGHTFGASGLLSLEMAVLMIRHNSFIPVPFLGQPKLSANIKRVLVNAVGFGGNAVSILIEGKDI